MAFVPSSRKLEAPDRLTDRLQHLMGRLGEGQGHIINFLSSSNKYSERKVCEDVTDRQTDKSHKNRAFCWWSVFQDTCRIGCWSFWSWFDV